MLESDINFLFFGFLCWNVKVLFHSIPHCEMYDRSLKQLSSYLSVPHCFEALTRNSDAINLSQM